MADCILIRVAEGDPVWTEFLQVNVNTLLGNIKIRAGLPHRLINHSQNVSLNYENSSDMYAQQQQYWHIWQNLTFMNGYCPLFIGAEHWTREIQGIELPLDIRMVTCATACLTDMQVVLTWVVLYYSQSQDAAHTWPKLICLLYEQITDSSVIIQFHARFHLKNLLLVQFHSPSFSSQ